jgi:hypothetical protein
MNYTEALEFFIENGISLTEEQLENLKEASAYTRYMRKEADEYGKYKDALDNLNGRKGGNVENLKSDLANKMDEIDNRSKY